MAAPVAANAAAAYATTATREASPLEARGGDGSSFADVLQTVGQQAMQAGLRSEQVAMQAALGRADITDVVMAVNAAEVTLQTVVGVRDRMVQAYQEILRMPI